MAAPYHTTLYENFFLLRLSISFIETPVTVERRGGRELLTWRPHSSSPNVSLTVESCATRLQECLHQHGGGRVGQVWFDGDVPLFLVNFHTSMGLRKLLAEKAELEKKLRTKLRRDWGSLGGVRCKVDTQLYLMCPDFTNKDDHKAIPVNNKNQESCMEMCVESQVLEFGSLLRGCRVEVPRPEVSMKLLLNDLTSVRRPYELGLQLGVPEADLDDIEVDYRYSIADRRREMLRKWHRIDGQPSWSKLVRALVAINERHVARNIAEKYGVAFPSELEPESTPKLATASPVAKTELDAELRTKTKPTTGKKDSKLAEIDKELDGLQVERRRTKERTASAREEAEVVVEDMERLEQEKQLLLEKIRKKESELECFKCLHAKCLSISQCEKEVLQETIKAKENELQEARAKLQGKDEQLKKYKEKIQKLKKRLEEGVRELGVHDGRITELENDKSKTVAALEAERMKNVERMETLRKEHTEREDQLRERLVQREDQLRKKLAEKDALINSHLKEISDLQQQLKVAEMNAQSLLQYRQLAELQEARMEREREKIAIESELMAVTSSTSQSTQQSTLQAARSVAISHSIQQRKLTVQCHKKKTAPRQIRRGSATTDDQFAYFTPFDSNSVYRYQWSTENWDRLPPSPNRDSGLVIIDGELTSVGGEYGSHSTNKLFTLQQGRWVEHYPTMNTAHFSPAVVSSSDGNYVFVIGGGLFSLWCTTTVELFHVKSRRWFGLTNLPKSLPLPSATICGNEVHAIGSDGGGYSCSLQALLSSDQPITSQSISRMITWTPLPQLPVTVSTAATLCGQLVLVGGFQAGPFFHSIHQLLDGQWVEIGSMSTDRSVCFVVTPSPDKMMIVGGMGESSVEECVVV